MTPQSLTYRSSSINYYRLGYGEQAVICFHGYGETAASFAFLENAAGDQFTLYAIDLPFHGFTDWKEKRPFSPTELHEIVQNILQDHQHTHGNGGADNDAKISLLGFSLGGRVCLQLFEMMPAKIKKMVLLAPDGLKVNAWYWLATQTWAGSRLFSFTMQHPGWFFGLLKGLNKLRLINQSIFKFVRYYIHDQKVRKELYERWMVLREIKPEIKKIKQQITRQQVNVRLVYGRHDRIILPVRGEKFCRGIEQHCSIKILNAGHQILHEKHAGEILSALTE